MNRSASSDGRLQKQMRVSGIDVIRVAAANEPHVVHLARLVRAPASTFDEARRRGGADVGFGSMRPLPPGLVRPKPCMRPCGMDVHPR
jgi:hypothetical protein